MCAEDARCRAIGPTHIIDRTNLIYLCLKPESTVDIDLLRTFVAIVDTGTFTHAAGRAHRSQSAISMQVKRLEEMVGEPLFARAARGVTLTRRGEALVADARRLLILLDEAIRRDVDARVEGAVRVGIPGEYGGWVLPSVLGRFAAEYPDVEVTVRCEAPELFGAALDAGDLDLAVLVAAPDNADGDILFHDPLVWVAADRHPVHEKDPLPLAIFAEGCWWRTHALAALDRIGRRYRVAYTSPSVAGVQAAVASGLVVAILGRSTVPRGARILASEEGFPKLSGSNVVVKRRSGPLAEAVKRMAAALAEAFADEGGHFKQVEPPSGA